MTTCTDVEFAANGGTKLRGWLFSPADGARNCPAITMAHGFAGVKEHRLDAYARTFSEAGFVVLVHDHRNFGASDGTPRNDIDPWQQIADWRRAISFLETQPAVDKRRIGLWGTSYAGGHAIVLGATDRRLHCIVAQVPTISGFEQSLRRVAPEKVAGLEERFSEDERAQFRGEPPGTQAVVSLDASVPAAYRTQDAHDFYFMPIRQGAWENSVTLRSSRTARMYEPGVFITRVSPTPLLMVVGTHDTITLTDTALAAYERALQPKSLTMIEGDHFIPYQKRFNESSAAALAWFRQHLGPSAESGSRL
jgi:fermentation-respiration switch protein FrsA (DUF1100 family)